MLRFLFAALSILPRGLRRRLIRLLVEVVFRRLVTEEISGKSQIPDGPCLFVCNHLSNADALALYRALRPKQVFFLAGVKLQDVLLTRIGSDAVDTIPIRPNSPDVEALKRAVETLKSGRSVLIFPEGTRSRTGCLIRAKKGAALIARRAGVPIVPIGLTGSEKFMPINEQDMGGEGLRRATITVRVGPPFAAADLACAPADGEDERQLLADAMMRKVASLLPPEYRGVYRNL
ncbi:MAG TPA: lysophospholipid acyltransferase family protein [Symbiobacteriaceae bacterium]|jgi:1-acyl-sn-glycerol-3-phosphate acyltransferase